MFPKWDLGSILVEGLNPIEPNMVIYECGSYS